MANQIGGISSLQTKVQKNLRITLWGDTCEKVPDNVQEITKDLFVLIVIGTKCRMYQGETYLKSTTSTTIYANLHHPRFASILESAQAIKNQVSTQAVTTSKIQTIGTPPPSTVLNQIIRMANNGDTQVGTYNGDAEITAVNFDENTKWNYKTCPICVKKVLEVDNTLWCEDCDMQVLKPLIRCHLKFNIRDQT